MNTTLKTLIETKAEKRKLRDEADIAHRESHEKVMEYLETLNLPFGYSIVEGMVVQHRAQPGMLESKFVVSHLNFFDPAFNKS